MDELIPWFRQVLNTVEAKAKAATRGPWRVNVDEPGGATVDGPDALQDGGDDGTGTGGRRQVMRPLVVIPPDVDYGAVVDIEDAEHIAFHNPEQVLRQVAADRRILAEYERLRLRDRLRTGPYWDGARDMCEMAVLARAEAYDDQPGYREVWRQCPTT